MSVFNIRIVFNNEPPSESGLKSMITDALEQAGYSEESWVHEGEYFYGDFSVDVEEQ